MIAAQVTGLTEDKIYGSKKKTNKYQNVKNGCLRI
jgi:hypothetical protein